MSTPAVTVRPRGVPGEASTVYFEREFQRPAVKVLPGEFFVSGEDVVLTTLLGSCVSACIWDTRAGVGGMNHFLLPEGGSDPASESGRYGAFAMELLINELLKCGAKRNALEAKVFGGGAVLRQITTMQVGERNGRFVLQFLKDEGIRVTGQDLYDVHARRIAFLPQQGKAMVKRLPVADSRLIADEQSYRQRLVEKKPAGDVELF